jgi:hypothetical protein
MCQHASQRMNNVRQVFSVFFSHCKYVRLIGSDQSLTDSSCTYWRCVLRSIDVKHQWKRWTCSNSEYHRYQSYGGVTHDVNDSTMENNNNNSSSTITVAFELLCNFDKCKNTTTRTILSIKWSVMGNRVRSWHNHDFLWILHVNNRRKFILPMSLNLSERESMSFRFCSCFSALSLVVVVVYRLSCAFLMSINAHREETSPWRKQEHRLVYNA